MDCALYGVGAYGVRLSWWLRPVFIGYRAHHLRKMFRNALKTLRPASTLLLLLLWHILFFGFFGFVVFGTWDGYTQNLISAACFVARGVRACVQARRQRRFQKGVRPQ